MFYAQQTVWSRLRNALAYMTSREARLAFLDALVVTWPLALRRTRRHKLRSVLFASCVAVAVTAYLLLGAFGSSVAGHAISQVEPLSLPADVVLLKRTLSQEDVRAVDRIPRIRIVEEGIWTDALTEVGLVSLIGVAHDSRTIANMGMLVSGSMPSVSGEICLPEALAADCNGKTFGVRFIRDDGSMQHMELSVSGVYRPVSELMNSAVMLLSDLRVLAGIEPNVLSVHLAEGAVLADVMPRIRSDVADAVVYTPQTPGERMTSLVSRVLSPQNLALLLVFGLSVLSMLNLQLISFLERKRQIGIYRALGMDAMQTGVLLLIEALLPAVAGIIIGVAAAPYVAQQVSPLVPYVLHVTLKSKLLAVFYALISFSAATWLPVQLSARATVDQLLHNRRVYLRPNLSCANCGRCGGF